MSAKETMRDEHFREVLTRVNTLLHTAFYGVISLHCQAGRCNYIKTEQSFKLTEEPK